MKKVFAIIAIIALAMAALPAAQAQGSDLSIAPVLAPEAAPAVVLRADTADALVGAINGLVTVGILVIVLACLGAGSFYLWLLRRSRENFVTIMPLEDIIASIKGNYADQEKTKPRAKPGPKKQDPNSAVMPGEGTLAASPGLSMPPKAKSRRKPKAKAA